MIKHQKLMGSKSERIYTDWGGLKMCMLAYKVEGRLKFLKISTHVLCEGPQANNF